MDDLISEFITETSESLAVLDLELVKLEKNPNDAAILGNIFRLVHTIKGTCGFLGLPRLEAVAHASENVLGKIRDKVIEVTPQAISLVLQSLDAIKVIMDHLGTQGTEPEGDDAPLIARLNRFAESNGQDDGTGDAASAVPASAPVSVAAPVASMTEEELDIILEHGVPAPDAPAAVAAMPVAQAEAAVPQQVRDQAIMHGLAAEPKEAATGGGAANQSIRVSIDVLENLMQMVSELVLTRNQLMQIARTRGDKVFMSPLQQLSHITTELQEGIMKTRMQPIGNAWSKFPRLIRDLSMELGKKIELRMLGAETELDRQLLELIKDPLTHMVRNSCDHGLEMPQDRVNAGKPEMGTVTLSAYHEGGHIIIEISDDGRGININRVKEKAISNGLASAAELEGMTEQQICQFIFRAGFSTAEKVTSVSGRGVGMDVVRTNIEKIGGTIELSSVFGNGSKFHIKIPLTLAIVSVLIVETGGEQFAIPQINVLELVRTAHDSEHVIEAISNAPVLRLRDKLLPLISLSEVLGIHSEKNYMNDEETFIVVCKVGNNDFGLIVDKIFDTEEIVVKPVSTLLKEIPVYSGNTILGDGSVIMILDPNGLAKATGDLEGRAKLEPEDKRRHANQGERLESFLLFRAGKGAPKAVPLELVSRLEEIDTQSIEHSGDYPVVQYRGDLMRLVTLGGDYTITDTPIREVIVFSYDNKTLGLVVEEILDIVEAPLSVKMVSKEEGYLGSMVIQGKTTDVVDVGHLLQDLIDKSEIQATADASAHELSILLVEDSMFFRNITAPFMSSMGFKVTSVGSAMEAIKLLDKTTYNIIVTDIEMPDMNGFTFAEVCKSSSKSSHIPIIAFTSTINQQLLERARTIGMANFILKTDPEGLVKAIFSAAQMEKEKA